MSDKRKEQARINGLKGGRKVQWEKPIKPNDPRRKTHRWLVQKDGKERLCKSKPQCPAIDLWRGPRPLCADMEAQYDAWHRRTSPDVSVHAAFKAGWAARGKCKNTKSPCAGATGN